MSKNEYQLYLQDYYNIFSYFYPTASTVKRAIARFINALIEALNDRERLPRYIIFILDKEIIEDVNIFNFRASKAINTNVNWLIRQANMMVRRKRLQILEKKPGAVYSGDPKIIFTTMMKRATLYQRGSKMEAVCSLRSKFNDIVSSVTAKHDNHLLQIRSCISPDHFDQFGNLSSKGKFEFWYEMDQLIQRFDTHKIKLLPHLHSMKQQNRSPKRRQCQCNNSRRRNTQY